VLQLQATTNTIGSCSASRGWLQALQTRRLSRLLTDWDDRPGTLRQINQGHIFENFLHTLSYATSSKLLFVPSRSQMSFLTTFTTWIDADFKYISTGLNLIQIDSELVKSELVKLCYKYLNSINFSANSVALEKKSAHTKFCKLQQVIYL
jgi:hypothetical protein